MSWSITIPGAPPSVNHSYRIVKIGTKMTLAKTKEVQGYQMLVRMIVGTARPRGWAWSGEQIRLYYEFYLKRHIDTDNAKKALNDAIALALGVNDKYFLTCDRLKVVDGKEKDPRVVVEIDG